MGGGARIPGPVSAWLVRVFDFTRAVRFLGGFWPPSPSCGTLVHNRGVLREDAMRIFAAYIVFCVVMGVASELLDVPFDRLILLGIGYWVLLTEKK